jgi:hypothetical protein
MVLAFVGSYPLAIGFMAQIIVLLASRKDKDRKAIIQSFLLLGALGVWLLFVRTVLKEPRPSGKGQDHQESTPFRFPFTDEGLLGSHKK